MDKIDSWAECFNRRAKYYDDPLLKMSYNIKGTSIPMQFQAIQARVEKAWDKLCATEESSCLDVGAGVGIFAEFFQPRLKKYVGTDISDNMIAEAHKLAPNGLFLVCDAMALPFKPNSFDRLLCYSVFHYFPDLYYAEEVLIEFTEIVGNNGLILIGDVPQKAFGGSNKHYPIYLRHNLKFTIYDPSFFIVFSKSEGYDCNIFEHDDESFDVIIKAR